MRKSDFTAPRCAAQETHGEAIGAARAALFPDGELQEMAETFKVLADPTRLKLVCALVTQELCVCDLSALLAMTQPAVSHHLKILRQSRLVRYRRAGRSVLYALDDEHVTALITLCRAHVEEAH
ncbi:MAG TPA: metalloregulator ArsR/SmtB family transcription factor [Oscillospiraceae bacterium]|nr:metalloregulator ArsR/SmtB family transcription factor [Oscillospiraceae bacterium]